MSELPTSRPRLRRTASGSWFRLFHVGWSGSPLYAPVGPYGTAEEAFAAAPYFWAAFRDLFPDLTAPREMVEAWPDA